MAADINKVVYNSADALHLNRYSVTPVNNTWVITEQTGLDSFQYWTKRDTQQDAIDEVLRLLNVADVDGIDAWNQPEPAMDLLERMMAAFDGGEEHWCCEREFGRRGIGEPEGHHAANCLLDQARKLCGPGD